jgi:hypothetical protein
MDLLRELASYAWLPNGLAALLGLPSALLYLVEVLIVWRCRHLSPFNSSFFSLFVVRALPVGIHSADEPTKNQPIPQSIFNLLCSYWGIRFGLLGLFYPLYLRMPVWLLNLFFFTSYYTYQVENLSSTFLLLNRFSSIAFPLSYDAVINSSAFLIKIIFINFSSGTDGCRPFACSFSVSPWLSHRQPLAFICKSATSIKPTPPSASSIW